MSGPWEVDARREGGRTVCRAYRKRDVKRPDTEENREYYGEPSPYTIDQEIYIDFLKNAIYISHFS